MAVPKDVEQLLIRNLSRIKINLQRLGVVAKTIIGGVQFFPTGVTHAGADNPFQTPKLGVRPPESAQGKGGRFKVLWRRSINGRDGDFVFSL